MTEPSGSPVAPTAFRTLGQVSAGSGAGDALVTQPKRLVLLLYLLLAEPRGARRRDELVALFWPDLSAESARNALSQSLYYIRKTLGGDPILSRGAFDVAADPDRVTCDVLEFEAALAAGRLGEAAALYQGPFLPGVFLRDAPDLERWIEDRRAELARRYAGLVEQLAREAEGSGDLTGAVEWWRTLAAHDPLDARATAGLIRTLGLAGRRGEALQVAERHATLVRDELGIEPGSVVTEAVEAVRREEDAPPRATAAPPREIAPTQDRPAPAAVQVGSPRSSRRRWILGGAALVLVAVSGVLVFRPLGSGPDQPEEAQDRVLVAPLQNRTGDPRLDALGELAADWVTDALVTSGVGEVVDQFTALYVARDLGLGGQDATPDQLFALRESTRSGRLVSGAIDGTAGGDSVAFFVRVTDLASQRITSTIRVVSPVEAAGTHGVRELAQRLAGVLGAQLNPMLTSAGATAMHPPRLEAFQQYLRGLDHWERREYKEAFSAMVRAAQLDTAFILPVIWARYTAEAGGGGIDPDRDSIAVVAANLVRIRGDQLTPLEREALISVSSVADTNLKIKTDALERAADLAPGSPFEHEAAMILFRQQRFAEAIRHWERVDYDRGWARRYSRSRQGLATALLLNGDIDRGLAVVREGLRARPNDPGLTGTLSRFLVHAGRDAERQALQDSMRALASTPTGWARYLTLETSIQEELRCLGRTDDAAAIGAGLVDWLAGPWSGPDRPKVQDSSRVFVQVEDWGLVERQAETLLSQRPALAPALRNMLLGNLGIALAFQGRKVEARAVSARLARIAQFPITVNYHRARIAGALGEGDSAVALLRAFQAAPVAAEVLVSVGLISSRGPWWDPIRDHAGYRALVGGQCAR